MTYKLNHIDNFLKDINILYIDNQENIQDDIISKAIDLGINIIHKDNSTIPNTEILNYANKNRVHYISGIPEIYSRNFHQLEYIMNSSILGNIDTISISISNPKEILSVIYILSFITDFLPLNTKIINDQDFTKYLLTFETFKIEILIHKTKKPKEYFEIFCKNGKIVIDSLRSITNILLKDTQDAIVEHFHYSTPANSDRFLYLEILNKIKTKSFIHNENTKNNNFIINMMKVFQNDK